MRQLCVIIVLSVIVGVLAGSAYADAVNGSSVPAELEQQSPAEQIVGLNLGGEEEEESIDRDKNADLVADWQPEHLASNSFVETAGKAEALPQTVPIPATQLLMPQVTPDPQQQSGGGPRAFYEWMNRKADSEQWAAVPNHRPKINEEYLGAYGLTGESYYYYNAYYNYYYPEDMTNYQYFFNDNENNLDQAPFAAANADADAGDEEDPFWIPIDSDLEKPQPQAQQSGNEADAGEESEGLQPHQFAEKFLKQLQNFQVNDND